MYYILDMRKERIFSLRLTSGMRKALEFSAKRDRRSIASLLEKLIADHLDREGIHWEEALPCPDRRQHPRKEVFLPAHLTITQPSGSHEETDALIENMSLSGSYVTYANGHSSPWKLQSPLRLLARIPGSGGPLKLPCRAVRVIRDQQKIGVGVRHLEIPGETLDLIIQFLGSAPSESVTPPHRPS
jgi:hypothetical protein